MGLYKTHRMPACRDRFGGLPQHQPAYTRQVGPLMRLQQYLRAVIACADRGMKLDRGLPHDLNLFLKEFVASRGGAKHPEGLATRAPNTDCPPRTPKTLETQWSIAADEEAYISLATEDEEAVLCYSSDVGLTVLPPSENSLVSTLRQLQSHVRDLQHSELTERRLASLLESIVPDLRDELGINGVLMRRTLQRPLNLETPVLAPVEPTDLDSIEWLGLSTWDIIGDDEAGPMTDNPGTIDLWLWDDRLIIRPDLTWTGEIAVLDVNLVKTASGGYAGADLAAELGDYYGMFVRRDTYAVEVGLAPEEIPAFLKVASGIGVVKVNGGWWHRIEGHWQSTTVKGKDEVPKVPAASSITTTLRRASNWWSDWFSLLIVSDSMDDPRLPLALLAGHKGDVCEQTPVAVARVDGLETRPWYGVAIGEDRGNQIARTVAPIVGASVLIEGTITSLRATLHYLDSGSSCTVSQMVLTDEVSLDVLPRLPDLLEAKTLPDCWRSLLGGEL